MVAKDGLNKAATLICCLLVLAMLNGCLVHAINPFYTHETLRTIPDLMGSWQPVKPNCNDAAVKPAGQAWLIDDYTIRAMDKHGVSSTLKYKTFKLGHTWFIDTTIANSVDEEMGKFSLMHVAPLHTICRLEINEVCLVVTPLNYQWIKTLVEDKKISFPHIWIENHFLFTAPAEQLVAFVKKYANHQNAFMSADSLFFFRQVK